MAKPKKKAAKTKAAPARKATSKKAHAKAKSGKAARPAAGKGKKAPKSASKTVGKTASKRKAAPAKASKAASAKKPTQASRKPSAAAAKSSKAASIRKPAAATRAAVKSKHVNEDVLNQQRAKIFAKKIEESPRKRERAFIAADGSGKDDMANEMGRDFLIAAETGKEVLEELSDEEEEEEEGGPFVPSSGRKEFAGGTDASNPADAEREPFPKANRG